VNIKKLCTFGVDTSTRIGFYAFRSNKIFQVNSTNANKEDNNFNKISSDATVTVETLLSATIYNIENVNNVDMCADYVTKLIENVTISLKRIQVCFRRQFKELFK